MDLIHGSNTQRMIGQRLPNTTGGYILLECGLVLSDCIDVDENAALGLSTDHGDG